MRLRAVCHACYLQTTVTASAARRVLACRRCRQVVDAPYSARRALDLLPCSLCQHSDQLANLTRRGVPVTGLASALHVDCPACGEPATELVDEALVDDDAGEARGLTPGDLIHCRSLTGDRAFIPGEAPCALDDLPPEYVGFYGTAMVMQSRPLRVRWEAPELNASLANLVELQLDVEGIPWLKFDLPSMQERLASRFGATWPAWERLVEARLETLLPAEVSRLAAECRLHADLSRAEQLDVLSHLESYGGEACRISAMFSPTTGEWVDWHHCDILLQTRRATTRLWDAWPPQPPGGLPWVSVEWRIDGETVEHWPLGAATAGESRKPPLPVWHDRGIQQVREGDWQAARYWLWRAARGDFPPSQLALAALFCGACGHPVRLDEARQYLGWAANHRPDECRAWMHLLERQPGVVARELEECGWLEPLSL